MIKKLLISATVFSQALSMSAQLIDFDFPGRNTSEVTEPNYIPWPVNRVTKESKTLDNGVTITVSAGGAANGLNSNWSKQSVQAGLKLFGDGVFACVLDESNNWNKVEDAATELIVTIEGLTPGAHSVLAYHLNTDKGQTLPPIEVEVDGVVKQTGVAYTTNADNLKAADVGRSYVEFDVTEGVPVVIKYRSVPVSGTTYSTTCVMVNGLEFDVNPYGVLDEFPVNHDFHTDADNGTVNFSWTGADIAVNHKLVYGTDSVAVAGATTYQYEGKAPEFSADGFSPLVRYWWRVDEVDSDGKVYKGKVMTFQPRRLAFPGAEGYGRFAIGGRGGVVYHVTSLADDGQPGTLRYGVEKVQGPRTIVFDVSGIITLEQRLVVSDKYVTIAGQTAPGRGILLRSKAFGMQSDGITRFMRLYLGGADDWNDSMEGNPNTSDGMGMSGNDHSIMDHCSIAWTIDEGFSSRNARNMTLQHTMISEALNYAGHATQYERQGKHVSHGYAATIGGGEMGSQAGSYHHNLLAHCEGRNWSLSGGLDGAGYYDGHHDVFNNVVYNWGSRAADGGTHELNFVNNYYKMGPATSQKYLLRHQFEGTGKGTQSGYSSGNIREEINGTKTQDKQDVTYRHEVSGGQTLDWEPWSDKPFFPSYAVIESAEAAFRNVLSDVGCNMPEINNHDSRVIKETLEGTTSTVGRYTNKKGLPDCESDAGGFKSLNMTEEQRATGWDTDGDGIPDWFEQLTGTDPNIANNNEDRNGDYYTDLEEYLNWIAVPNYRIDGALEVTLAPLFAGYTAPAYAVEQTPDGVAAKISDGVLTVTPSESAPKMFTVKVKGSQDGVDLIRPLNFAYAGGASGIINVIDDETEDTDAPMYDLLGRRVTNPTPGIYLRSGKKIVIR